MMTFKEWLKEKVKKYSLKELKKMETIEKGQTDNLKFDDGKIRVWLSRMTIADDMPYNNQVTVEELKNGSWKTVDEYEAK